MGAAKLGFVRLGYRKLTMSDSVDKNDTVPTGHTLSSCVSITHVVQLTI